MCQLSPCRSRGPRRVAFAAVVGGLFLVGAGFRFPAWGDEASDKAKQEAERAAALEKDVTQGALRIVDKQGGVVECPLKHTDVQAEIAGFVARVRVTQTFVNPTAEKIEAVYVFPLPHEAAVDEMTMVIGPRRIVGLIKRRAEARRIYEQALAAGQTAALLEQERPNIFTQSVGNIPPGQEVQIEIAYVDVLRYDMGNYEFHFPMVVGPRYNPGAPIASPTPTPAGLQGQVSPPVPATTRVPDAARISPPVLKPGFRNGHDISLSVKLDAGVPIQNLVVANHRAAVEKQGDRQAAITLSKEDALPNKDFVLRYDVTGDKPAMAVLAHTGKHSGDARRLGEGYFLLMIQPKEDERLTKSPPREIVFLCDVSGSMSGLPTQKVIEAMQNMLKLCRPQDTVQVITFASQSQKLFDRPVPVTEENIKRALNFTAGFQGGGGTEMLKGVKLAIDEPLDKERVRIVVMLTDGYIGNEAEIIEHVGKHCGDQVRFWAIGIGASPNMFLIDGVAKQGGGMGKKLGLEDDAVALTQEVISRIQRAQLAKLKIDWGPHQVLETYPAKLPELWAGRPVMVFGRYTGGSAGRISVSGSVEGEPAAWPLDVQLPAAAPQHDVLAKVWARQKIESLMQSSYYQGTPAVEEEVTALALDYQLMSQYTSFVAVDTAEAGKMETPARPPRRMPVPVPLPQGTQWEGFFGAEVTGWDTDGAAPGQQANLALSFDARSSLGRELESRRRMYNAPARGRLSAAPMPSATAAAPALAQAMSGPAPGPGMAYRYKAGEKRQRAMPLARAGGLGGAAYGGRPAAEAKADTGRMLRLQVDALKSLRDADEYQAGGGGLVPAARPEDAAKLLKAAQEALTAGQAAAQENKWPQTRTLLLRAYLLDTAASFVGASDGSIAAAALEGIEQAHAQEVAAWTKATPGLGKRLDLVLRDRSLTEALEAVATAAGLTVQLTPGSVDDAAALAGGESPRVTFLDLRGATAAQALDWLLQPARLGWWLDQGTVRAASDRRRAGQSAWVYDVTALALPPAEELRKLNDAQKAMAAVQQAADEFLTAVRKHLQLSGDTDAAWFAPGQLLVIGTADQQAAASRLLATLADPHAKPAGELVKLHAVTSVRAATQQAALAKQRAAQRQEAVAAVHDQYGWQLLAAAADGRLDLEALTELQIAWQRSETGELLASPLPGLALRSLWIVREAARALPQESELQQLAQAAAGKSQAAVRAMLAALAKNAEDPNAYFGTLYATLALPDDGQLRAQAAALLTKAGNPQSPLASVRAVAAALLSQPAPIAPATLEQWLRGGLGHEDLAVLTALACCRAGGDSWQIFRAEAQDLLAQLPLPGHVVVLVNRLAHSALPLSRG